MVHFEGELYKSIHNITFYQFESAICANLSTTHRQNVHFEFNGRSLRILYVTYYTRHLKCIKQINFITHISHFIEIEIEIEM